MSRVPVHNEDWLSRVNIPDVYPRRDDPFKPSPGVVPSGAPPASYLAADQMVQAAVWDGWLTTPGTRPVVFQRALNYVITANTVAVPLTNGAMQCETIVLSVLSTLGTSAFFGFGSAINDTSGTEIRPGVPAIISTENGREQWELQRLFEAIAGMLAADRGYDALGPYRAPRVVFDASDYFVFATTAVPVRVMLFTTPEYQ